MSILLTKFAQKFTIVESDEVELAGLAINKEPNFSKHIDKV